MSARASQSSGEQGERAVADWLAVCELAGQPWLYVCTDADRRLGL